MYGQYNPYMCPQQNILPPQQILQAKGKASIDMIRMSPNSSVLIADETAPIVWKCISDSLGNVSSIPFDITPHVDEEQKVQENLAAIVANLEERLKRLENDYEQSITKWDKSTDEEYGSDKADVGNAKERKQSTSYAKSNNGK